MCVYSVGKVDSVCGAGKLLYEVDTIRLEDLCVQGTTPLTALFNRGMTVEATQQWAKDRKAWRALLHM